MIRLENMRPQSKLADGFGMLKYSGKKRLEDFDIGTEMRKHASKAAWRAWAHSSPLDFAGVGDSQRKGPTNFFR